MAEYEAHKTGFFSQFPFGTFAFARLNDRLSDCKAYTDATRIQQEEKERKKGGQSASNDKTPKEKGRDGMNLTAQQPHVEMWNTECYGPHAYADTPSNDKHAFAMIVTLFSAQSRGSVTISSADPTTLPVVNHNHLSDPRDAAVLAEGCRLANEIVTQSHSLDGVVVGGWPKGAVHHEWKDRASWEGYVRANANTCSFLIPLSIFPAPLNIALLISSPTFQPPQSSSILPSCLPLRSSLSTIKKDPFTTIIINTKKK